MMLALQLWQPALQAEECLRTERERLGVQAIYYLTLEATGDKELAENEATRYMEDVLRAGGTPRP